MWLKCVFYVRCVGIQEKIRSKIRLLEGREELHQLSIRENCLKWFGYVSPRPSDTPVRRREEWQGERKVRGRGRLSMRVIESDMWLLKGKCGFKHTRMDREDLCK